MKKALRIILYFFIVLIITTCLCSFIDLFLYTSSKQVAGIPISVARTFEILISIVKILPFSSMFSLMVVNMYLIRHEYKFLLRFIPSLFLFLLVWGFVIPFSAVWYEDLNSSVGQESSSVVKLSAGYFRQNGNNLTYIIPDSEGYRTGTVWTHAVSDSLSEAEGNLSQPVETPDIKRTYLDSLIRDSLDEPVGLFALASRVSNLRNVICSALSESIWKYFMFATMGLAIFSLISFTGYSEWRFSSLTLVLFYFSVIVAANVIFYDGQVMQRFLEQLGMRWSSISTLTESIWKLLSRLGIWLPFIFNLSMALILFIAGFIRQRHQKAGL